MNITDKMPNCLCIYPSYDGLILMNLFLIFIMLINIMFEPFDKPKFQNKIIDTNSLNIYSLIILITINTYFFIFHFFFEKLAHFLGYL